MTPPGSPIPKFVILDPSQDSSSDDDTEDEDKNENEDNNEDVDNQGGGQGGNNEQQIKGQRDEEEQCNTKCPKSRKVCID